MWHNNMKLKKKKTFLIYTIYNRLLYGSKISLNFTFNIEKTWR